MSWLVDGGSELALANGIRVGSSIEDLRGAYPDVATHETTLGVEWFSQRTDIAGFLDEETSSRVTGIWAGTHCAVR